MSSQKLKWLQGLSVARPDPPCSSFLFVALASLLLGIVMYFPVLTTYQALIGADFDYPTLTYPSRNYVNMCLKEHILPLWNPYVGGGLPVETGLRSAFTPGTILGYFFSTGSEIKLNAMLHGVLACFGIAGLPLNCGRSPLAALFGGLNVGFGGVYMTRIWVGHLDIATAFGWVPLAMWAMVLAMRRSGLGWTVLTGLAFALQVTNGHYQTTYLMLWVCFVFTLLTVLLGGAQRVPALSLRYPWRKEDSATQDFQELLKLTVSWRVRFQDFLHWSWRWLIVGLVTGLLTCFQWYSHLESMGYTNRGNNDISFILNVNPSPLSLLTFALPGLFDFSNTPTYFCHWLSWEGQYYQGIVTSLLALLALLRIPRTRSLPQILIILLCLGIMLGSSTPFFGLYYKLDPGVRLFRAPARFVLCLTMMMAWLAALGFDYLFSLPSGDRARRLFFTLCASLLGIYGLLWLVFNYSSPSTWFMEWLRYVAAPDTYQAFLDGRTFQSPEAVYAATRLRIGWASMVVGLTGYLVYRFPRRWAMFMLLTLSFWDYEAAARPHLVCSDEVNFGLPQSITEFFQGRKFDQRLSCDTRLRLVNRFAVHGWSDLSGYDGFGSGVYEKAFQAAVPHSEGTVVNYEFFTDNRLADIQGARFFISADPLQALIARDVTMSRLKPYATVDNLNFYENPNAVPRAFLVHEVRQPQEPAHLLNEMLADPNVPLQYVLLAPSTWRDFQAQEHLEPGPPDQRDQVSVVSLQANEVDLDVSSKAGGLLVLTDIWWPGWLATVDGQDSRVWPVHDGLHRGVAVTPGPHRVIFLYHPQRFFKGLQVALATFVLIAIYLGGSLFLRGQRHIPEGSSNS